MNLFDDVLRSAKKAPVPKQPGREAFDSRYAKNAKPKRARDNNKKSRRSQRQSVIGQQVAAIIGGDVGPKQKKKAGSALFGPLGGLSRLGG